MDKELDNAWATNDAQEDRRRDEPTEPSAEWDVENYAAARSNWQNGAGDWDNYAVERANYRADTAALDAAEGNLPFGKVN